MLQMLLGLQQSCNFRGQLRLKTVNKRLELLKLEGLGFSHCEGVNESNVK
jgi:hypothetical protein